LKLLLVGALLGDDEFGDKVIFGESLCTCLFDDSWNFLTSKLSPKFGSLFLIKARYAPSGKSFNE
jgi:hypothetical protein